MVLFSDVVSRNWPLKSPSPVRRPARVALRQVRGCDPPRRAGRRRHDVDARQLRRSTAREPIRVPSGDQRGTGLIIGAMVVAGAGSIQTAPPQRPVDTAVYTIEVRSGDMSAP